MRSLKALTVLLSCLSLPSCSVFDFVNAFNKNAYSEVQRNVSYGEHPKQKLDIYRPLTRSNHTVLFVFFYGGGWDSGSRSDYEFVGRSLASEGHFVVIPDYRVYPDVTFPEFVNDGALATKFVLEWLSDEFGDRPVFLMGHSAGAHIAILVAVDQRYLRKYGRNTAELSGAIGLAGPYDFLPITSSRLKMIFPTQDDEYKSQPINFTDSTDPEILLLHGDQDERVRLKNSLNMAEAITKSGGRVTLRVYPGVTHTGIIRPFTRIFKDRFGLLEDIKGFVSSQSSMVQ